MDRGLQAHRVVHVHAALERDLRDLSVICNCAEVLALKQVLDEVFPVVVAVVALLLRALAAFDELEEAVVDLGDGEGLPSAVDRVDPDVNQSLPLVNFFQ